MEANERVKTNFVLVYGNIFDGMRMVGPFQDSEDAVTYAESQYEIRNDTWTVVTLPRPRPD